MLLSTSGTSSERKLSSGQHLELPAIDFTVIYVGFDAVADPKLREYLQNLPTSFVLSKRRSAACAPAARKCSAIRQRSGCLSKDWRSRSEFGTVGRAHSARRLTNSSGFSN